MTRTTYKEQMAEAKRIEDLEMMLKGAIQRGGELLAERDRYRAAIEETLEENRHLADGEDCTLIKLKRSIGWESGAEK